MTNALQWTQFHLTGYQLLVWSMKGLEVGLEEKHYIKFRKQSKITGFT